MGGEISANEAEHLGNKMATAGDIENYEDVPPLEDMSDALQSLSKLKLQQNLTENKHGKTTKYLEATETLEESRVQSIEKLLGKNCPQNHYIVSAEKKEEVTNSEFDGKPKKVQAGFAGFKKGFLLSNSSKGEVKKKPKNKKAGPCMEELKANTGKEKKDPLVLSEVQQSRESQIPFLQSKEWITDDLLSKVAKNPKLLKQLEDPKFSQALAAFQTNPQSIASIMQTDPEIRQFIQDFCALLGDHFAQLGEKEENTMQSQKPPVTLAATSSRRLVSSPPGSSDSDEQEKFRKIINDPEIQSILSDPRIQNLITVLKERPNDAQRNLAELGPEYHSKIQRLIEAGLLGVSK